MLRSFRHACSVVAALGMVLTLAACVTASGSHGRDTTRRCEDPFCTFAPPLLTGDGMAAAARAIIRASTPVPKGYPSQDPEREKAVLEAFLAEDGFEFISPFLVVQSISDPRLRNVLSPSCIEALRVKKLSRAAPVDTDGPVFLYRFGPTASSPGQHVAVAVFGYASTSMARGMSADERIDHGYSGGRLHVYTDLASCRSVLSSHAASRRERQHATRYTPLLFGLGLFRGELLSYSLSNVNSPADAVPLWTFRWHIGFPSRRAVRTSPNIGSSMLAAPDSLDPFALINQQEFLP